MTKAKSFIRVIPGTIGVALALGVTLWVQAAFAGSAADRAALASALTDLVSAEYALDAAEQDYLDARSENALSDREDEDYKGFIAALRRSLNEACDRVERLDASMTAERESCRSVVGARPVTAPTPGQTRSERVAAIDAELQASVAEFDGLLQREQLELEKTARNPGSEGGDAAGGGQGGEFGAGDLASEGEQTAGQGATSGGVPDEQARPEEQPGEVDQSRGTVGPPESGPGAPIPDDVPEAQDDDIVARQLREAAENETDPELRKRLWEEYRRYKESRG